jgi:hypothetical protein
MAQQRDYNVNLIPDSLKKNADAVIRYREINFTVKDIDRATYTVTEVITILSEEASQYANFFEFTNKFYKLSEANVKLYDANGKLIEKYKKKEMSKVARGEGLVDDGYVVYLSIPINKYPVTVEQTYETEYLGTLFYPSFLLGLPNLSIEHALYQATVPIQNDLRYLLKDNNVTPQKTTDHKSITYKWEIHHVIATDAKNSIVNPLAKNPKVLLAPSKFKMDDYEGDMTNWQKFGLWYAAMSKDAIELPVDRVQYFKDLTKNISSEKEKIKILYQYLQTNFRYVSIQLGIGGYKPFAASFTDKKKYGDCKALSNYMQAILQAVGIKSHQVLIHSGYNSEPLEKDFPSNQFDHVILCVPSNKDTVWLECTSQKNEFGVLGNFTENRTALLITENGGVLVNTPMSKSTDNIFTTTNHITIDKDGSGTSHTIYNATGEFRKELNYFFENNNRDEQKSFLINYFGFKQPDDFLLEFNVQGGIINMSFEKIHEFNTGSKYFINTRMHKLWDKILPSAASKKKDFYFKYPFIKTDSTIYHLPVGSVLESLPKNKEIQTSNGNFKVKYEWVEQNKTIIVTSYFEFKVNKIAIAAYATTKDFFEKILVEQNEKIIFKL